MTEQNLFPDFSGDDFANDKEILARRAQIRAYNEMKQKCLQIVESELSLKKSAHINFKSFEMFRQLTATISHSMKSEGKAQELRVSVADYYSAYYVPKGYNSGIDEYLIGHLKLRLRYPHTYIHKETIKDKLEDVFLKRDLDFAEHKKFSRRFQVLTRDSIRLYSLLQSKPLDELAYFPDMEMEFIDDRLLFRSSCKPISIEEAKVFCELAKLLVSVF